MKICHRTPNSKDARAKPKGRVENWRPNSGPVISLSSLVSATVKKNTYKSLKNVKS